MQQQYQASAPTGLVTDTDGLLRNDTKEFAPVWIAKDDTELLVRILVMAHAQEGVHCSQDSTDRIIRQHFYWEGMTTDIRLFVSECIHCLRGARGRVMPRPLGETLTAQYPNEILHVDFLTLDEDINVTTRRFARGRLPKTPRSLAPEA
eukprot:GHVU01138914.1.p1 GENE.GHVU01138914.1~~GHVU01138914.1.p1  ORF type:complete len:149 (+),score=3.37 GHVU01138914.1:282-728(+)